MQYYHHQNCLIFTARKRSLGQGNIFTPVRHSVHGGGGTWAGNPPVTKYTLLGPGTPPRDQVHPRDQVQPPDQVHPSDQVQPPDQVHPSGPGTPSGTRYTPWTRYTPKDQVHPPGPGTPPRPGTPWDQVHPRAVHAGRYGQQAGGTHPTGMHSCGTYFQNNFFQILE